MGIQVVKDVLKTFMIHVNPDEFFKAGGDPTKLSVLLGKECQKACGKQVDFRKDWHEPGSIAEASLSSCTKDIIPFLIKWQSSEDFHKPNFAQLDTLANLVASRLALEEMYAFAAPQVLGQLRPRCRQVLRPPCRKHLQATRAPKAQQTIKFFISNSVPFCSSNLTNMNILY